MKKGSGKRGKSTSEAEVTSISGDGICLQLDGLEYFLDFENFPWFRDGAVRAVLNVRRVSENHLSGRIWTSISPSSQSWHLNGFR